MTDQKSEIRMNNASEAIKELTRAARDTKTVIDLDTLALRYRSGAKTGIVDKADKDRIYRLINSDALFPGSFKIGNKQFWHLADILDYETIVKHRAA